MTSTPPVRTGRHTTRALKTRAPDPSGAPVMTSTEPTAPADVMALRDLMMQWVRGERSHWNTFCRSGSDREHQLAMCAIADAQEVVKLSAAIQALAAVSDGT